jgi:hypothetical protein
LGGYKGVQKERGQVRGKVVGSKGLRGKRARYFNKKYL